MTVKEHCRTLGWSVADLMRKAEIDRKTADKAYSGQSVSSRAARAIASALSEAYGETIRPGDIPGLQ